MDIDGYVLLVYNPYSTGVDAGEVVQILAHKQEHAVDMETGVVVAMTIQGANQGDTSTLEGTLEAAQQNLEDARKHAGKGSNRDGERRSTGDGGGASDHPVHLLAEHLLR